MSGWDDLLALLREYYSALTTETYQAIYCPGEDDESIGFKVECLGRAIHSIENGTPSYASDAPRSINPSDVIQIFMWINASGYFIFCRNLLSSR